MTTAGEPLSSAAVDQVDDQVVSVLKARAELRPSRLGAGADEEQLPVSDVGQVQAVVDLGDAAGSRQVLEKFQRAVLGALVECRLTVTLRAGFIESSGVDRPVIGQTDSSHVYEYTLLFTGFCTELH